MISWAEEVGVEVGKGRVEVVDVDQVEVEVEVVEVVEEEEEVVEVAVVVDLRNNARHSLNPPALPGDNQILFANLNILLKVCGEKTGPICGRHILRKTSKRALWKRLTGKTCYLNLHLAWKNVLIWGK